MNYQKIYGDGFLCQRAPGVKPEDCEIGARLIDRPTSLPFLHEVCRYQGARIWGTMYHICRHRQEKDGAK